MSRENAYRGSGGVPYATRDFLDPHFGNLPSCACIFGREKNHPHQKKCAIDQARCLASPTYPVYYLTPSELGEISISKKNAENVSTLGELALSTQI